MERIDPAEQRKRVEARFAHQVEMARRLAADHIALIEKDLQNKLADIERTKQAALAALPSLKEEADERDTPG